jgi:hypothetical protein
MSGLCEKPFELHVLECSGKDMSVDPDFNPELHVNFRLFYTRGGLNKQSKIEVQVCKLKFGVESVEESFKMEDHKICRVLLLLTMFN